MKTIFQYLKRELRELPVIKDCNIEFDAIGILPSTLSKDNVKKVRLILINNNIPLGVTHNYRININLTDNSSFIKTIKNYLFDDKITWTINTVKGNNIVICYCNKKLILNCINDSYELSIKQ